MVWIRKTKDASASGPLPGIAWRGRQVGLVPTAVIGRELLDQLVAATAFRGTGFMECPGGITPA